MTPLTSGPILIDQVYQQVLEAIADARLRPGQRLRQGEIADLLGVSRQPVSHALHLLKRQGLVRESGRKGFEVAPIDPDRIRQLYEVRAAMDALAARLAARRVAAGLPAAARRPLADACAAGAALPPDAPISTLIRADAEFHRALYRLSGNPAIEDMLAPHWPHLTRSMAAVLEPPEYRARAWAEHADIMGHVLAGDARHAERAAHDHAERAGRTTCARLAQSAAGQATAAAA
ncbi:MAG: GntR family transcriptional regulator [Rhodospirillales bacterium]|nr:GntR family transcriptional regulator [Rhodospirillales bacterium]